MSDSISILSKWVDRLPSLLIDALLEGRCVLFVGAGLSAQVRRSDGRPLPLWKGLLTELIADGAGKWLGDSEVRELTEAVERGGLIEAAGALQDSIQPDALQNIFIKIFGDEALRPSATHLNIPAIRLRAILTTNYDSLIEDGFEAATGEDPLTFSFDEYRTIRCPIRDPQFFVLKVHGDYRNTASIVLGLRNYQDIIHYHPLSRMLLKNIFSSNTVLFVGYGGSDPDVDDVINTLSAVLRDSFDPHYLVLPRGRLTAIERNRFLVDRRLGVIEYDPADGHREVAELLAALRHSDILRDLFRPSERPRLLIAIHRADRDRLSDVTAALEKAGFAFSCHDLDDLWTAVALNKARAAIERSTLVVHVMSRNYQKDYDMIVAMAHTAGRDLIPLLLDGIPVPEPMGRYVCSRICESDRPASVEALVRLLGATESRERATAC